MLYLIKMIIAVVAIFGLSAMADSDEDAHQTWQSAFNSSEEQKYVASNFSGFPVLEIEPDIQKQAGIKAESLTKTQLRSETIAYGEVVDLKPLLKVRSEYLNAAANFSIAEANLQQAKQNLSRVRGLHKNQAISTKKLQAQETLWQSANAEHKARYYQLQAIEESAILSWGAILSQWLLNPETQQFSDLIKQQHTLLQITLPPDDQLPEDTETIYVSTSGNRDDAKPVQLFSAAPHTDDVFQGETYYFRAAYKIRTGMHLTAWIPQQQLNSGYIIPETAVLRYLGLYYVYVKLDSEHFVRKQLPVLQKKQQAYFSETEFDPGQELVVQGAQMLLSEELRGLIPDEDDDD